MLRNALAVLLALGWIAAAGPAQGKEESLIIVSMEDGDAPCGSATLRGRIVNGKSTLHLRARHLEPDTEHTLLLDGVEEATFTTDSNGRVNKKFSPLSFDPRGKLVEIDDGTDVVLRVIFSGPGEPDRIQIKERTDLEPTDLAPKASGEARYDTRPNGKRNFGIRVRGLDPGSYNVYVDDMLIGSFDTSSNGSARIDYEFRPPRGNGQAGTSSSHGRKKKLNFDPRHKVIEIRQGDDVHLEITMLADLCESSEIETDLDPVDAPDGAEAQAEFEIEGNCEREFEVEVVDLDADDYDLAVAGDIVGSIHVEDDGEGGTFGEIEFSSNPEAGELLLAFDPIGALIEILDADQNVLFEGRLPE